MQTLSLYIHIPFCERKCAYCDFNAYSNLMDLRAPYVDALISEIHHSAAANRRSISTIFFGGGTPTTLSGDQFERIVAAVHNTYDIAENVEISSEANPTTSDAEQFAAMHHAGVNRISIGVQSFQDNLLLQMDRNHSANEAIEAYRIARSAGFKNVNLDLIFATPGQSLEDWKESIGKAVDLHPEHLSIYGLTIEPGTRFERLNRGGKLKLPTEDAEIEMFQFAREYLTSYGYEHYEISNYAKPGFKCKHNLNYWANGEYRGFGAGAVSYQAGCRWKNEKQPGKYIEKVNRGMNLRIDTETLTGEMAFVETLMLGLRLLDGYDTRELKALTPPGIRLKLMERLSRMAERGWLVREETIYRLSEEGLLLANDVSMELLPD